jgi:hypothetical protein
MMMMMMMMKFWVPQHMMFLYHPNNLPGMHSGGKWESSMLSVKFGSFRTNSTGRKTCKTKRATFTLIIKLIGIPKKIPLY